MTALLVSKDSCGSRLWIGNTLNLGCEATSQGHLNVGLAVDQVLAGKFVEWFADFWRRCAALTTATARVPALVPATGDPEAANSWRAYQQLCKPQESTEGHTATGDDMPTPSETVSRESAITMPCKELKSPLRTR